MADGLVWSTDSLGNLIDVLGLDDGLQVILEHLGEIVWPTSLCIPIAVGDWVRPTLEFRATEVLENLLPVRRIIIATQVGLQLSAENLQCRALANTVCANETQHLARTGHRQPVQLEAVGRVSMGDLGLEVRRQVDDVDSVEGTFLWADTASDAQPLRDEGNLGVGGDFDAQLACADDRASLFALLATFLETGQNAAGEMWEWGTCLGFALSWRTSSC